MMYVREMLSMLGPQLIICITDMPEEALIQCSCDSSDLDFYQLPNSKATELDMNGAKCQRLPPGCMITGCSAAFLSAAEV